MGASEHPLRELVLPARAVARVARAQDDHVGRPLAQRRPIRDRLQQAAIHHRLAPVRRRCAGEHRDRAARPHGAQQLVRAVEVAQHAQLRGRGRHGDRAELGPGGQPGLGERPAPGDDLIEQEVEIDDGPASERARPIDERAAGAVLEARGPQRRLAGSRERARHRSRRAAVDAVEGGHEAGGLEHEAHAGAGRAAHPSALHHERDEVWIRPVARAALLSCALEQHAVQRVLGCGGGRWKERPHMRTVPPSARPGFPRTGGYLLAREGELDRALGVQAGGVEHRHRRVLRADQQVDLGTAEQDRLGALVRERAHDPAVLLA